MLREGRLPLKAAEHDAAEKLIAKHPDQPVSLTRRDPGETGPLLAHVGDTTYEIDALGHTVKQRKPRKKAG